MPPQARWTFALAVLPHLFTPAAGQVNVSQTPGAITISNGKTKLRVALEYGRANGLDLIEAKSDRVLARIEIGGRGRWTAACKAEGQGASGAITFSAIVTKATGGTPTFGQGSAIRVGLSESGSFPLVQFRLGIAVFDRAAWQKAIGSDVPVHFLSCRMASASVFYQGGFQMPLPGVDPFPVRSRSIRGDWTHGVTIEACPVPAVGLWNPAASTFVGYEFQQARSANSPNKHIASAYGKSSANGKGECFALLIEHAEAPAQASKVEGSFRLVYSTELPPPASVNEFVLRHIWDTYRDSLPAAPTANDVGWMPKRRQFVPDDRTDSTVLRRVDKGSLDECSWLFLDGALLPTGSYRSTLNLLMSRDAAREQRLWEQWRTLVAKAIKKRIEGEECVSWRFPLEGDYEPRLGGASAATTQSPRTWLVGASLLAMYQGTNNVTLLPYIDGIFRWARHCTFTRAGDPALPAAASAPAVAAASAEFFLNFYHVFKSDRDAKRRAMAEDAIALGRAKLYRSLAVYTGDPDVADNLDPTFLVQANSDPRSFGLVSWRDTGEVIRAMALYYVETGDPVLGYFVRGALQRWPLGHERDGLQTIESLDVFGVGPGTKGTRAGLLPPDEALAEYIQPIGSASVRVLCGRKQVIVFCANTEAAAEDYRFQEDGSLSFRLVTSAAAPVEINVTSPLRSLRGKRARVNGEPADVEAVGLHGENVIVRGVMNGDIVTVGGVGGAPTVSAREPAPAARADRRHGNFTLAPLSISGPSARALSRSWDHGMSWAGLVDGVHYAWGVPFRIMPGRGAAVHVSKGPFAISVQAKASSIFVFGTPSAKPPTMTVVYADGEEEKHELSRRLPALSLGQIRTWRIHMYPCKLRRPGAVVERAEVSGDILLFAITTHPSTSAAVEAALARQDAKTQAREAEARAARERQRVQERIVPDSRAKVAAATRGKTLRIAFLPPHEAYTKILRTACNTLGAPPAMLSPESLVDPAEFNPERYPIAVYSAPETFVHTVKAPGDAARALERYLSGGGCLVSAARGYPFYYPMILKEGRLEKIKGARHAETCQSLEILIKGLRIPPLKDIPRFELMPGQEIFTHLPKTFRFDATIGGPYRPAHADGLPGGDTFTPIMRLTDMADKTHGVVVATIDHKCKRYNGGRVIFMWGNILAQEIGPTIALDLMTYAICAARLEPAPTRRPCVAILPRDTAGHEKAIARACSAVELKTHTLTPEEFVDPAVFNAHNFPIAIHAVRGEYYLDRCAGRSDVGQVYVNYVKSGGLLVACGNMFQFYYAGTIGRDGKWRQKQDRELMIPDGLGFRGGHGFRSDPGPFFLKCLPDQDVVRFDSPIPLEYIHWGRYRVAQPKDELGVEFVPIAQVVDKRGKPFHGYVIALVRYKSKELADAGVIWFWGDLLDNARTYPIFDQVMKYAYGRRRAVLAASP